MNLLLDTNVISEAMRKQPSARVLAWMAAQAEETLFISVLTLGELRRGALMLTEGRKRKSLLHWVDTGIKVGFAERILPIDSAVIEQWARLEVASARAGRRLPVLDSLIAATALAHNLTLATRNTADFQSIKMPLVDPWQGEA